MEIAEVNKTTYVKENNEIQNKNNEVSNKENIIEDKKITEKEVLNLVKKLNENVDINNSGVKFEKSEDVDKWIVKVYNPESGELIRQIPEKEIIQIAKNIDDIMGKIIDKKV